MRWHMNEKWSSRDNFVFGVMALQLAKLENVEFNSIDRFLAIRFRFG